jgi:hypothetical protein
MQTLKAVEKEIFYIDNQLVVTLYNNPKPLKNAE